MNGLQEGEMICSECDARGHIKVDTNLLLCPKCFGRGVVDWLENIVGRKDNPSLDYYLLTTTDIPEKPEHADICLVEDKDEVGHLMIFDGQVQKWETLSTTCNTGREMIDAIARWYGRDRERFALTPTGSKLPVSFYYYISRIKKWLEGRI